MRLRFRFRLVPLLATVALVALGIALGNWQERRAAYKTGLQQAMAERAALPALAVGGAVQDAASAEFRRVRITGSFVPCWTVYLDNRPYQNRAGLYVLTPLRIAGSDMHVLVARGWLPRDAQERTRIAPYATPAGELTVDGIATAQIGRALQLGGAPAIKPGALLQNVDVASFARASGLKLQPFIVEQSGDARDNLVRDWPAPSFGIDTHKGYAFQWYALAAMAFLFYLITGFVSGKREAKD